LLNTEHRPVAIIVFPDDFLVDEIRYDFTVF